METPTLSQLTTRALRYEELAKDYSSLVAILQPRPIHSLDQFERFDVAARSLAGFNLTPDQEGYLDALSTFMIAYEDEHEDWG